VDIFIPFFFDEQRDEIQEFFKVYRAISFLDIKLHNQVIVTIWICLDVTKKGNKLKKLRNILERIKYSETFKEKTQKWIYLSNKKIIQIKLK